MRSDQNKDLSKKNLTDRDIPAIILELNANPNLLNISENKLVVDKELIEAFIQHPALVKVEMASLQVLPKLGVIGPLLVEFILSHKKKENWLKLMKFSQI